MIIGLTQYGSRVLKKLFWTFSPLLKSSSCHFWKIEYLTVSAHIFTCITLIFLQKMRSYPVCIFANLRSYQKFVALYMGSHDPFNVASRPEEVDDGWCCWLDAFLDDSEDHGELVIPDQIMTFQSDEGRGAHWGNDWGGGSSTYFGGKNQVWLTCLLGAI